MVNTLKGFRKWRSLKGSDMAALIGKRSSVMGKFWDGCSKDDEDKLYPCVIKEYDDRKKIARIAALQQMVRVEMIDDAAVYNEEEGLWIALTMMSDKMMLRSGETKAGGKTIVSADGSLITRLKFEDAFNYHVDWVSMCYTDAVPFHRAKTPGTRRFAASLRPGYVPPTRDTSIKVLALDMMTSCGVAYVTLNLSFVDDEKSGFVHKNVQLAYEEFPEGPHTGKNIATWIANTLALHGIDIENVGAPTIDGAANGKRAMKILKLAFRICAFHQGMRCVHYALRPLALKAMFKVFKKLALYTTKESTKFNEAMKAAQRACGIVSEPQPALNMLNPADTRADGAATMLERAIEIEPALRMTLKKTHADLRGDEIIDGELDEAAVEETASIVSSDDEDSPPSDDDDERPKLSKKKAMDEAKLMKRTPTPAQWNLARQMLPVLLKVKEFNKLVQYSTVPTTDRTLPMARQLLRSLEKKSWSIESKDLLPEVREAISIMISQVKERFFAPGMVTDRDMIALHMNPLVKVSDVFGGGSAGDAASKAATQLYSRCEKSLLDQAFDDLDGSSDDDASMDVDACEMTWLDELRSTPKKERKDRFEFKAGLDGEKHFSALHLYTSKLRKALQGKVIAPMLRCKANHDLFFEEIKAKIYERYFRKYRNNATPSLPRARPKDDADDDVAN
ncbi:hypothetical protein JL720_16110 [Aureococcus anophagefferens]|nr:hypothetical protein JL720_16110 [Aureococcus anophagefferens]